MMLSWDEAYLFLRAGDDMRFATWPTGDFVRASLTPPAPVPGYDIGEYSPLQTEIDQPYWSRA